MTTRPIKLIRQIISQKLFLVHWQYFFGTGLKARPVREQYTNFYPDWLTGTKLVDFLMFPLKFSILARSFIVFFLISVNLMGSPQSLKASLYTSNMVFALMHNLIMDPEEGFELGTFLVSPLILTRSAIWAAVLPQFYCYTLPESRHNFLIFVPHKRKLVISKTSYIFHLK